MLLFQKCRANNVPEECWSVQSHKMSFNLNINSWLLDYIWMNNHGLVNISVQITAALKFQMWTKQNKDLMHQCEPTVILPNSRNLGHRKWQKLRIWVLNKGTASLEVKNSERNRELENFASLEPRVCEVLLYMENVGRRFLALKPQIFERGYTVMPRKLAVPNSRNSLTHGSSCCPIPPNSQYFY